LVIYKYPPSGLLTPIWGVGADCNPPYQAKYLVFQSDGNLVIYCRRQSDGYIYSLWATNTWMH
jgi:hypothetical protein